MRFLQWQDMWSEILRVSFKRASTTHLFVAVVFQMHAHMYSFSKVCVLTSSARGCHNRIFGLCGFGFGIMFKREYLKFKYQFNKDKDMTKDTNETLLSLQCLRATCQPQYQNG